ncbi:beta-ketoacyl-ACP synthase II [Clostridium manihotivorum]|uniref:3-oxoacyl-[acyl-carrier-protein] synthase 2 n=1 Tax=Clostridium manihotivorum TaxID=2320868 RepID=A0A410DVF8_9CLOT|nr:beta-ketoacyl-ACP synthase II [Clostridium manihotivorum]QAA32942.1 beta-ketoacyl-[acyl-carrier-protein] synthase II [Clostridium manihotivorum]
MSRRVVITGMGVVSSVGIGAKEFWQDIKIGKSGISLIERVDVSEIPTKVAAEIKNFEPGDFIERKEVKRTDRFSQFALAATKIAMDNSKLNLDKVDEERMGVIIGTGVGGIETTLAQHNIFLEKGPSRVSPFLVPMMIPNMASGLVAIKYGAKGFNECTVTACATSTNSIGDAFKAIQRSDADVMIAGGAEAPITGLTLAGFSSSKTMTTNIDPKSASRPFDLNRDGFVLGEGAGIVILEELEHALKREADIIAEVVGYGCTNDAYHITSPSEGGEGAARCMKRALEDASVDISAIGYINAHGTSTKANDRSETSAIKTVFGDASYNLMISSTKSMTGHLLGATGAVEAIITAYALQEGFVPPTINYSTKDPECDLNYVPNEGKNFDFNYALSNSFGFGGHNATLVLKKFK